MTRILSKMEGAYMSVLDVCDYNKTPGIASLYRKKATLTHSFVAYRA